MIQRIRTYASDGAYFLGGVLDLIKWPFERAAWAVERKAVWPLRERAAGAGGPTRAVALGGIGLLAAGALAFGVTRVTDGGESAPVASVPVSAPAETAAPAPAPEPVDPVLQGAAPDFSPAPSEASAGVADADTVISSDPDVTPGSTVSSGDASSSSAPDQGSAEVEDPGPAAIDVARRFSGAFVLYETGSTDAEVRKTFAATASPQLTKALLRRPPRLPANVEVPKAKVLNVVPGPRTGDTFTLSASLLRVGITSELRIDVQRAGSKGKWQVTDVLG